MPVYIEIIVIRGSKKINKKKYLNEQGDTFYKNKFRKLI